jgi:FkbM family methyltransferase
MERAGAHAELAAESTRLLREITGLDLEIAFEDGLWQHRAASLWFPDGADFAYPDLCWEKWPARPDKHRRDAADYWFHVYKPAAGDTIVDIGAGRGEDVFAFSEAVGPAGTVWAIEAHPASFRLLQAFCRKNALANVRLLNNAVMDRAAALHIETLPVWESNFVYDGPPTATSHAVEGLTFDALAARDSLGPIHFLKMNIEGAERFALPGMRATLPSIGHVCIAAHDFRAARGEGEAFRTHSLVVETLERAGFTLVLRSDDPRYYVKEHIHGFRAAR